MGPAVTASPSPTAAPVEIPAALLDRLRGDGAPALKASTAQEAEEPSLEQRLVQRITMGWTLAEQARVDAIGYDAYLEEQLDYGSLDTSELEQAITAAFPGLSRSVERNVQEGVGRRALAGQLQAATLLRAVYSPRQLFERLVVFWSDHFSIDIMSGNEHALKIPDDRDVIRRHAMGRFPDLLRASASSPAMVEYLTNDKNVKDHPNENYARELMELHTMGAGNGYDQEDVREVARCFTGWSTWKNFPFHRPPDSYGTFRFVFFLHDAGDKRVLGHRIPGTLTTAEGEAVIEILAAHPNTARFLARKLARYFWGYEPPENLVERVARVYLDTGGSIRAMVRTILRKAWLARATPKLKRPFHLMTSALRALGGEITDPGPLLAALDAAGHLPFTWKPPDGFPDTEEYWAGYLLPRWETMPRLADPAFGARLDLAAIDPTLTPGLTREEVRGWLNETLFGGTMPRSVKTSLRDFLAGGQLDRRRAFDALGLALSAPEFQRY